MSRRSDVVLIAAIMLVALWLRARGLDWGLPYPYHPDEGSILFHSLAFGTGDLNPHWFRWPSLLMYFMFGVYGVYFLAGRLVGAFGAPADILRSYLTDLTPFWLMGRWVSALAGVATVWVTYRIGRRAFGTAAGLIGALFLAVTYLHVRDSHYATPDVAATLLASLSLLAAIRACESGRARDLVLSGLLAGLSASAKYPGALASVGTLAAFAHLYSRRRASFWPLPAAAAACVIGFVAGTPYSVLAFPEFLRDLTRQFTMVSTSGVAQEPTTFAGGLWEVFGQTMRKGIGYPLVALAVIGAVWRAAGRARDRGVLAAYAAAVIAFAALITVKRSTYLTPALPALAALAGGGLCAAVRSALSRGRFQGSRAASVPLAVTAVALAVLAAVPSVRFGTAIAAEDTRTTARDWVEREVAPGAAVAVEEYGPVLNPSERQLRLMVAGDTTSVEEWKGPQRALSEMRLEIGRSREPRYDVYGIGHGVPPFRLPEAAEAPQRLATAIDSAGVRFVVLSSKAAPWRDMEGAAPAAGNAPDPFYEWLRESASLRRRFAPATPVPEIDRGAGRSFHSPVIEVYEMRSGEREMPRAGAGDAWNRRGAENARGGKAADDGHEVEDR